MSTNTFTMNVVNYVKSKNLLKIRLWNNGTEALILTDSTFINKHINNTTWDTHELAEVYLACL